MAALVEGRQYGLSSKGLLNENKSRILVKFTDSALRAVEDYLNSRSGSSKYPTIQFHGNQGLITFPSLHNASGEHSFSFGLSSTADIEGPQGSFECIQQCGSRSLESLGSLQFKMHIHAKEDVYEVTRQRMAEVEEESKKNCTKVIKASGPYVGRKFKKHTLTSKVSSSFNNSHTINHSNSNHAKNGNIFNNSKPNGANGYHNTNNNNSSSSSVHYNKSLSNPKPGGNSDIQKRPFRERIIHLLALRPYKLPELLARLMKDGLGDKDKQCLSSILSKVAVSRDNTYTIAKPAWGEIQEDWPFYTEFDRQLLRRRKAHSSSLLPPTQSSGNDSPLNSQTGSSPNSLQKRPALDSEPPSAKRARISHYNHSNGKHETADGHGPVSRGEVQQNNPRPESNHVNGYSRTSSDNNRNGNINRTEMNGYHNGTSKSEQHTSDILGMKGEVNGHSDSLSQKLESNGWNSSNNHNLNSQTTSNHVNSGASSITNRHNNNLSPTLSTLPHMTPLSSPDGQDSVDLRGFLNETSNGCVVDVSYSDNYSDYLKKYTEILNPEQRARYKADYNAEYLLYRDVHTIVDRVSRRFTVLKENLRNVDEGSEDWVKVKEQILSEYSEMKYDSKYQDARQKFQIMHEKLSHIKRLILEYDQQNGTHS